MNFFRLSAETLYMEDVRELLRDETCGAHVIFEGTVRNSSQGKRVTALEFEAYEPMVQAELDKIAVQIHTQWKVQHILLFHRLGRCEVLDTPVIAAVSSVHRAEAFAACAWLMDRLKATVPIWKKELFTDGAEWVSPTP